MTALILAMLRARRGQAVTLGLLAMFAVAVPVAAPGYLAAVDRAAVAAEVAAATPEERQLSLATGVDGRIPEQDRSIDPVAVGSALLRLDGFTQTTAVEYPTVGIDPDISHSTRFVARQDVCAHLRVVAGRCLMGEGEVVVGERTAGALRIRAGDPVELTYAVLNQDPTRQVFLPDGRPKALTVVGVYAVADPEEPYWGRHGYFATGADGRRAEPVFTNATTQAAMDHGRGTQTLDAWARPEAFTPDRLDRLAADLAEARDRTAEISHGLAVATEIPDLLNRIQASRPRAGQVVAVAAVPLVLLAYFVIFLVVGYGTDGRRPELAVVRLRGLPLIDRWWLATGEYLLAILAGAVAGGALGLLAGGTVRYGVIAGLGAVLVALGALRATLASPVLDLLRLVPRPAGRWRLLAGETALVLLASVVLAQLWLGDGALTGVGLFAPALVIMVLGQVVARLVPPLAGALGRRALLAGRLGSALAAFQLARRPGTQRVFLLLVAAVALLGFAVTAVDVAAQDRTVAARVALGAPRVLSLGAVSRSQLLYAVRAEDPAGRYAMAVTGIPAAGPGEVPKLAVDSVRLPAVADWPAGSAARVAARLRPPAPDPVLLAGQDVTLDLTVEGAVADTPVSLSIAVSSTTGRGNAVANVGVLRNGAYTYQQRVSECADGCRLVGFHVVTTSVQAAGFRLRVTLRALRTTTPDRVAVPAAGFAAADRWRSTAARLSPAPDGLVVEFDAPNGTTDGGWVKPLDTPPTLPVVTTGSVAGFTGLDGRPTAVRPVATVAALPRLGTRGTIVDLEYADRVATDAGTAESPEVWLAADAPADLPARLAARGLVVTGDRTVAAETRRLEQQGAARALRYHLGAAVLAVLLAAGGLALVAAADRSRRVADLAVLRVQGAGAAVAHAARWTYPLLVTAGCGVGSAVGLAAWAATGWALPLLEPGGGALPLPGWPRPVVLIPATTAALLVLLAVATATARTLRRTIDGQASGTVLDSP